MRTNPYGNISVRIYRTNLYIYSMSTSRPSAGYHILALATIFVWGTTFASTKVLLTHGLTPPEIMFYRFIIAYANSNVNSQESKKT